MEKTSWTTPNYGGLKYTEDLASNRLDDVPGNSGDDEIMEANNKRWWKTVKCGGLI